MTQTDTATNRRSAPLKIAALSLLFGGFVLELLAIALNSWSLFKVGLFLFLMGFPCYLFGLLSSRRR